MRRTWMRLPILSSALCSEVFNAVAWFQQDKGTTTYLEDGTAFLAFGDGRLAFADGAGLKGAIVLGHFNFAACRRLP